jgi:hypothetical protein
LGPSRNQLSGRGLIICQPQLFICSFLKDKRRDARKRQKQRLRDAEKGSGSADANEMADDEALLADTESEKPEQPQPFNEEQTKKDLEKHASECKRPPGEPKIHLELIQVRAFLQSMN